MPDTVTVSRPTTSGGAVDPAGTFVPATATAIYSGAARLRPAASTREATSIFGDGVITETRYVLTVPYDTPVVLVGDVVTVSASDDPSIDLRAFRVTRRPAGSWLIDRRLGVETTE
jgi:hypothetical protein